MAIKYGWVKKMFLLYVGVMFLLGLGNKVNAASFDSMKKHIIDDNASLVHPHLYRPLTEEERKTLEKDRNHPQQVNRTMTKEEATEYIKFVEEYQEENKTTEVPNIAYTYIQYITEELDKSQSKNITDTLRADAKKHIETKENTVSMEKKSNTPKNEETKNKTIKRQSDSLWEKIRIFIFGTVGYLS